MVSTTCFINKIITVFVIFALVLRPSFASTSNPSIGAWTVVSAVADGIGKKITATKEVVVNGVSKTVSATAKITPPPSNIAKFLLKTGATVAVTTILDSLLDGVDYVMDPANNSIQFKPKLTVGCTASGCHPTIRDVYMVNFNNKISYGTTPQQACANAGGSWRGGSYPCLSSDEKNQAQPTSARNPTYNPNHVDDRTPITLPISNVATQIINQAEQDIKAGNVSPAVNLTRAVAQDMIEEAETDASKARPISQELDKSVAYPSATDAVGTITTPSDVGEDAKVSDIAVNFPEACAWFPQGCQAAQIIIDAPSVISDYIDALKAEYADEAEPNTDTELDIEVPEPIDIDTDINFGGSCPAPLTSDVTFMGLNETIEFSFEPLCRIAQFISPVVITLSAFSASLIIAGIRTEDD